MDVVCSRKRPKRSMPRQTFSMGPSCLCELKHGVLRLCGLSAPVEKISSLTPVDWREGFDHVEDSRRREEFKSYPCGIQ